jgi:two-component system cell cycle response regulator DivK
VGQKILVVEDNELNLRLFCDLLRVHGYEAEPVRDGREAVDRARVFAPDLIVMDIQMPHISGLELIDQIKADDELKAIPVMAVTAYAAKGDEERIRDAGAEGYVSKPISVMKFIEAVRDLLDAAEARATREAETPAQLPEAEDVGTPPADDAASEEPEPDQLAESEMETAAEDDAEGEAEEPQGSDEPGDMAENSEKPEAPAAPPAEESDSPLSGDPAPGLLSDISLRSETSAGSEDGDPDSETRSE